MNIDTPRSSDRAELLSDIKKKMDLPKDALFELLASDISKGAIKTDLVRRGREIFRNLKAVLQERICGSAEVWRAYSELQNDRALLVSALVDCVAGAIWGVAPTTFCVILVKVGLEAYCSKYWKRHPNVKGKVQNKRRV